MRLVGLRIFTRPYVWRVVAATGQSRSLSLTWCFSSWDYFLLGSIATVHIKAGLVAKKSLVSGFTQLFVLTLLISTGLLLYYGTEEIRDLSVWSHWVLGLIFMPVFVWHASKRWRTHSALQS